DFKTIFIIRLACLKAWKAFHNPLESLLNQMGIVRGKNYGSQESLVCSMGHQAEHMGGFSALDVAVEKNLLQGAIIKLARYILIKIRLSIFYRFGEGF